MGLRPLLLAFTLGKFVSSSTVEALLVLPIPEKLKFRGMLSIARSIISIAAGESTLWHTYATVSPCCHASEICCFQGILRSTFIEQQPKIFDRKHVDLIDQVTKYFAAMRNVRSSAHRHSTWESIPWVKHGSNLFFPWHSPELTGDFGPRKSQVHKLEKDKTVDNHHFCKFNFAAA